MKSVLYDLFFSLSTRFVRYPSLIRGRIITITVKGPCGLRLIKTVVRVIGFHGVALFGADAVCLHHKLIAAAFPGVKCVEGICHFPVLPCGCFFCGMRACTFAERHEHGLVIIAGLPLPSVLPMYLLRAKAHLDHLPAAPALHLKHRPARRHLLNVKDVPPALRVRASDSLH